MVFSGDSDDVNDLKLITAYFETIGGEIWGQAVVNRMNRQSGTERREETSPEVHVQYLEDVDVLQVRVGEFDGEWETLGQGLVAYYDSHGTLTGFWIDGASYILKPIMDALNEKRIGEHESITAEGRGLSRYTESS